MIPLNPPCTDLPVPLHPPCVCARTRYIPDGMSKAQWEAMKKKEAEQGKGKNLGAVGITKFKSRSFEAWQKSGQKNMFPVDPSTPLEERPYMMRPGGQPDGSDLKAKGLVGRGLGAAVKIVDADTKYEELQKKGALKSTPFDIPWTSGAASKAFSKKKDPEVAKPAAKATAVRGVAAKKGAAAAAPAPEPAPEKKKGFFGLF